MTRLNLWLLCIAVFCALGVVTAQHKARRAYGELQRAESEMRRLQVEWGQLQLEQSTWAMHSRIEREAGQRLGMSVPDANRIRLVALRSGKP